MDIRAVPYPCDFKVISTPGNFTGWALTVDYADRVHSVRIYRTDTAEDIANSLVRLAEKIRG